MKSLLFKNLLASVENLFQLPHSLSFTCYIIPVQAAKDFRYGSAWHYGSVHVNMKAGRYSSLDGGYMIVLVRNLTPKSA